ncbi:MAG: hypothetical protein ABIS27_07300 [Longimicrobiales bacterium]
MSFRNQTRVLILAAAVAGLAGCGRAEPLKVQLQGDSITDVATLSFPGGIQTAECGFTVDAVATGSKGDTATFKQGRLVYTLLGSGDTMMARPMDAASLASFWEGDKPVVAAGSSIKSKRQGISVSIPVQALQGELTFDYETTKSKETQTTAPFRFTCR